LPSGGLDFVVLQRFKKKEGRGGGALPSFAHPHSQHSYNKDRTHPPAEQAMQRCTDGTMHAPKPASMTPWAGLAKTRN
jgi:hypothetical protein